jgi:hypothetical protein
LILLATYVKVKNMPIPYTDIQSVQMVMKHRKTKGENGKPLNFRVIAELMKKDVKTVYRWYLCGVGDRKIKINKTELSTDSNKKGLHVGK